MDLTSTVLDDGVQSSGSSNGFTCETLFFTRGDRFPYQLNDYQGLFSMELVSQLKCLFSVRQDLSFRTTL
jgi:hypothetical protein